MAPDKIFLLDYQSLGMSYSWYDKPQDVEIMMKPENVEYIRKDSLLAWLNGVKSDPMIPMNLDKVIDYIKAL